MPEQHTLPVEVENPVPRLWGDIVDPLIVLARASAATITLKLGTAVVVVPARNPIILAKEVATLDIYTIGREGPRHAHVIPRSRGYKVAHPSGFRLSPE